MTSKIISKILKFTAVTVGVVVASLVVGNSQPAFAAVSQPAPTAQVSFTFDDGLRNDLVKAAPTLAGYGITGTAYITTDCIGSVGTCPADETEEYLTWQELAQLQSFGWEIGGHSVTHPEMSGLNASKLEAEVANCKATLESHGFLPKAFATPFGDYNATTIATIAKYFTSHRGFADTGYNTWPYSPYLLRIQQVQAGVSVATVKGYIDQAKANKTWLILVFHGIKDAPSTDPEEYEYSTADLAEIAAYVKAQGVSTTNVTNALVTGQDNLLPDITSLQTGWTTDVAKAVTADSTKNGSAPEPTQSLKVVAQATVNVHLFSPIVAIDPTQKYVVKGYLNITKLQSGTVGIYVDEYDANGNWISGQYMQTILNGFYKDISFAYNASSQTVAKVRLQIIFAKATGITAYVDNVGMYSTGATSTTPPAPAQTVVFSTSFENGLSGGWTTDSPTTITADNTGKGASDEPQNSIKLVSSTSNKHLFSPKVAVSSSKTYTLQGFLNVTAMQSGEVAFYIDEYDANGNWVSGKYLYARRITGSSTFSFTYAPTSSNVAYASLQVIVTGNSGITAYLDSIKWSYFN
jgi:peptidoglycan/xylan/chitin deacetylase (PgdA/CDA1 family)